MPFFTVGRSSHFRTLRHDTPEMSALTSGVSIMAGITSSSFSLPSL
ncbi:MAG: hypothetical protein OJF50_005076 [Nitrospira sp.]|nr:hypothetical protein [Nitrospira sp.]